LRRWFYSADAYSASLVTESRHARAVAELWRKKAGKEVDPLARIDHSLPPETNSLNDNCLEMEERWLDEAARLERQEERDALDTSLASATSMHRTRTVGLRPSW
jgi:hypothetical protein